MRAIHLCSPQSKTQNRVLFVEGINELLCKDLPQEGERIYKVAIK